MVNPFRIPFKPSYNSREKALSVIVFGLFIFLFLFLFKPFGLNQVKAQQQLLLSLGFGIITTFVLLIFKYLLQPVVIKSDWTLGKNIVWDFLIATSIGIANYFYINIVFSNPFIFNYLLVSVWTTILVGSIPVTLSYFITINKIYKTKLNEVLVTAEESIWESEVIIKAGNPRSEFRANPRNIIYLCSNDNYVTIVTFSEGSQHKTTIRGTLQAAEKELERNPAFLRCHKCYIVNLDFAEKITGHNQNMKIRLLQAGIDIPVSRGRAPIVNKRVRKS